MTASKSSLIEEPFLPQVLRDEQVIRGIDWKNAPFLFGYVVTSPKPTATASLITERGDPLFVSWRFGLGKSGVQLEILRLVAGGLTNPEIAARLVVSVRTVDNHVAAILEKLGTRTRREAATKAAELGVVGNPGR